MFAGDLLLWMIAVPLLGSLVTVWGGRRLSVGWIHGVGVFTAGVALALTVKVGLALHASDTSTIEHSLASWVASGIFHFDLGFSLDALSSSLALLLTAGVFLGQLAVMQRKSGEANPARVVSMLNGLLVAGLVVILADNLLLLFGGWCWMGLGMTVFRDREGNPKAGRVFVLQRLGDVSFFVAILLLAFHCSGTTNFEAISFMATKAGHGPFHDPYTLTIFCLLLLVAVASQVRLFPFHWTRSGTSWNDAFQSITAITASVYLLMRLSGLFTLSTTAMTVMAALGALTALIAAIRAIGYSDAAQLLDRFWVAAAGLLVLALGMGAYGESVNYWIAWAGFGFLVTLASPSVVGGLENLRGCPRRKWSLWLIFGLCFPLVGHMSLVEDMASRSYQVPVPAKSEATASHGSFLLIGGEHGTVLTTDDGKNWTPGRVPMATLSIRGSVALRWPNITGATMADDGSVWAVTNHGIIYHRTEDGWSRKHSPDNATEREALHGAWALSDSSVWFVGAEGRVLHYDGSAFQKSTVGTPINLYAVTGRSATEVYAGGDRGLIYRYDGTEWIQSPSVGSGRITAFALAPDGLYAITSQGQLFYQVNDTWLEVPDLKESGVEPLAYNAIAVNGDGLVVGGSVRREGKAVPAVLIRSGGQWTASTGQPGGVVQGLLVSDGRIEAVGSYGNGRSSRLWRRVDDRLESVRQLPYRPGHHWAYAWIACIVFLLLTFAVLNFLLRSWNLGLQPSPSSADTNLVSDSDLSALSVLVAAFALVSHTLFFGLLGSVGRYVVPEWLDINESIQTLLSVADSRLHLDPSGSDVVGVYLGTGFFLIAALAAISRFPIVRRFGRRLSQWLAPLSSAIAFVLRWIARLPAGISWVLRGFAWLFHRVLDQWLFGTLFVRLPGMLLSRVQGEENASKNALKIPLWSVVVAVFWVVWLAGVCP